MSDDADRTGICLVCHRFIEHIPATDLWQHITGGQDHPAVPEPGSEKEVPQ